MLDLKELSMHVLPKKRLIGGQTLLIVVLIISVSLVVVMSVVTRTLTDIKISGKNEESLRAFSAAETGIEKALIAGSAVSDSDIGNSASFTATVTRLFKNKIQFVSPLTYLSGESATIWMVDHTVNGDIAACDATNPCYIGRGVEVCWKDDAAIEASVYYATDPSDLSTLQVLRKAYDPDATRRSINNFSASTAGTCTIAPETFPYHQVISYSAEIPNYATQGVVKFVRIRFLYNTSPVTFGAIKYGAGVFSFPSQGLLVTSRGTSGEANRKVNVFQAYNEIPSGFDTALYSLGGIIK